jgi:flavin prenyltransferase
MSTLAQRPIVFGITGASGVIYAVRTLQWLLELDRQVHLVISPDAQTVIAQELEFGPVNQPRDVIDLISHVAQSLSSSKSSPADGKAERQQTASGPSSLLTTLSQAVSKGLLVLHQHHDYFAPVASGSYRTAAMLICPCSGSSLAAIAQANGRNLIHRAAEVHLKERRKLILVPRETPLSLMQLENMLRVTQAGAVVLPAAPGWYHGVSGLADLVDFIAARVLDQLDIDHSRVRRWSS